MGAPVKFLFDDDFASSHAAPGKRMITAAAHEAALTRAEAEGHRKGMNAAEAKIEGRATGALERIAQAIATMTQGLSAIEARLEAESVEVAVAVARKLAPELIAAEPFGEIAALVTECFRQLTSAPHVVVRVNDALHETARDRLTEIARTRGFEGRLVVVAEPEIALGDCKIEWADGGVIRDQTQIDAIITTAIARYLGARPQAVMPELGGIS